MSDFESFLASSAGVQTSSDGLKALGKQAAARYVRDGTPLNLTIAGMVKEASLNSEQTKRVIEEANNTTFVELFNHGFKGNVEFPLADFEAIASNPHKTKVASLGYIPPAKERYIPGAEGADVHDIFGADAGDYYRLIKEASAEGPSRTLLDCTGQMASAKADFDASVIEMEEQLHVLGSHVKTAAAEGYPPAAVGACLEMLGMTPGVQAVVQSEFPELVQFGEMAKYAAAGMAPDPAGQLPPLVMSLEMTSQQLMMGNQLMQQAQMAMDQLLQFLRGAPQAPPAPPPGSEMVPQGGPPGPPQGPPPGPPGPPAAGGPPEIQPSAVEWPHAQSKR